MLVYDELSRKSRRDILFKPDPYRRNPWEGSSDAGTSSDLSDLETLVVLVDLNAHRTPVTRSVDAFGDQTEGCSMNLKRLSDENVFRAKKLAYCRISCFNRFTNTHVVGSKKKNISAIGHSY